MTTTMEELAAVAALARLEPKSEKLQELSSQCADILNLMGSLESVNTESVEPMSHVHGTSNVFRADEVEPSFDAEKVFLNAPQAEDDHFVVPLAIESPKN